MSKKKNHISNNKGPVIVIQDFHIHFNESCSDKKSNKQKPSWLKKTGEVFTSIFTALNPFIKLLACL